MTFEVNQEVQDKNSNTFTVLGFFMKNGRYYAQLVKETELVGIIKIAMSSLPVSEIFAVDDDPDPFYLVQSA